MINNDLLLEGLKVFKPIQKRQSKYCDICNKTIKHGNNFPIHLESDIHIRNVQRQMYKSSVVELTKQVDGKKRKFSEEYSTALNLMTSLRAKDIKISEMG